MQSPLRVTLDDDLWRAGDPGDLLSRIAWAGAGAEIEIVSDREPPGPVAVPDYFDEGIADLLPGVRFAPPPPASDGESARENGSTPSPLRLVADGDTGDAKDRSVFIANRHHRDEGMDLSRFRFAAERKEIYPRLLAESSRKLERFQKEWSRYGRAQVIATGPSFSEYRNLGNHEEHFVVTCNSAVINEEFMTEVNPDLLVFGDPIFHFGPSRYAADFRAKVREAAQRYDFRIAVKDVYYFTFRHAFPELMDRTLFVPTDNERGGFHWRFAEKFEVKGTSNVLTQLMLPFAASVAREIEIIGCDGRPWREDSYFWGHDPSAQINDKMRNIQEAHPGFFEIDYNHYYLTHCRNLEQFFTQLEADGIRVTSRAFSHIPALGLRSTHPEGKHFDREILAALRTERQRRLAFAAPRLSIDREKLRLVSINPSLRSCTGHALHQDASMRRHLQEQGGELASLGHADLVDELAGEFVLPVFEENTWRVHRTRGAERMRHAEDFVDALFDGLEALAGAASLADATLFFYLGHPAMLPELLKRWSGKSFECRQFVFNVFSGYFTSPHSSEERSQWAALSLAARQAQALDDFTLVFDSVPLARDFEAIARVGLPALPMSPSQTLAPSGTRGREGERIRVLFPSQAETIRGYDLIVRFLERFGEKMADRFEFVIRAHAPWAKDPPPQAVCENATWIEGELEEEAYRELLESADLVLLPYCPEHFRYRTSSILAEAFSLGKPVLAMSGSWLGREVDATRAGWSMDKWNPLGLKTALEQVWEEREKFDSPPWVDTMARWCEANRIEHFVDAILGADKITVASEDRVIDTAMRRLLFHDAEADAALRAEKTRSTKKAKQPSPAKQKKTADDKSAAAKNGTGKAGRPESTDSAPFAGPGHPTPGLLQRVRNRLQPRKAAREEEARKQARIQARAEAQKARAEARARSKAARRREAKTRLTFEKISQGFEPGEKALDPTVLVRRYLEEKGHHPRKALLRLSPGDPVREREEFSGDLSAFPEAVLVDPGEDGSTAERAAADLEALGYQVLVFQEHVPDPPETGGSFYRLFPYPSYPVADGPRSAIVAFSTWARDTVLTQWIGDLMETIDETP